MAALVGEARDRPSQAYRIPQGIPWPTWQAKPSEGLVCHLAPVSLGSRGWQKGAGQTEKDSRKVKQER